jgi:hypothetical protein
VDGDSDGSTADDDDIHVKRAKRKGRSEHKQIEPKRRKRLKPVDALSARDWLMGLGR